MIEDVSMQRREERIMGSIRQIRSIDVNELNCIPNHLKSKRIRVFIQKYKDCKLVYEQKPQKMKFSLVFLGKTSKT